MELFRRPDFDHGRLVEQAMRHGLLAALAEFLNRHGLRRDLPARLRAPVISALRHNEYRAHFLTTEAARVAATLADAGLTLAFTKGVVLQNSLYGVPGIRNFNDIDLMIAPGDREPVRAALLDAGFTAGTDFDPGPRTSGPSPGRRADVPAVAGPLAALPPPHRRPVRAGRGGGRRQQPDLARQRVAGADGRGDGRRGARGRHRRGDAADAVAGAHLSLPVPARVPGGLDRTDRTPQGRLAGAVRRHLAPLGAAAAAGTRRHRRRRRGVRAGRPDRLGGRPHRPALRQSPRRGTGTRRPCPPGWLASAGGGAGNGSCGAGTSASGCGRPLRVSSQHRRHRNGPAAARTRVTSSRPTAASPHGPPRRACRWRSTAGRWSS
ncbi:nucleotidyltransferase family protein [Streptomyces sp. M19]